MWMIIFGWSFFFLVFNHISNERVKDRINAWDNLQKAIKEKEEVELRIKNTKKV